MKPVADGMVADFDVTLPVDHSLLLSKSAVTFVPEGRQGNNSVLLPGGGPGLSSVPSLCHTSGVGKSVSQSLNN